jgi:hypothetical protein
VLRHFSSASLTLATIMRTHSGNLPEMIPEVPGGEYRTDQQKPCSSKPIQLAEPDSGQQNCPINPGAPGKIMNGSVIKPLKCWGIYYTALSRPLVADANLTPSHHKAPIE